MRPFQFVIATLYIAMLLLGALLVLASEHPERSTLPPGLGKPLQPGLQPRREEVVGGMAIGDEPVVNHIPRWITLSVRGPSLSGIHLYLPTLRRHLHTRQLTERLQNRIVGLVDDHAYML